jgi:hypothetical protein
MRKFMHLHHDGHAQLSFGMTEEGKKKSLQ